MLSLICLTLLVLDNVSLNAQLTDLARLVRQQPQGSSCVHTGAEVMDVYCYRQPLFTWAWGLLCSPDVLGAHRVKQAVSAPEVIGVHRQARVLCSSVLLGAHTDKAWFSNMGMSLVDSVVQS